MTGFLAPASVGGMQHFSADAELLPGRYFVEIPGLPAAALDRIARRPAWREELVARIDSSSSARVRVWGGGVQHNDDGERVLAFGVEVIDPADAGGGTGDLVGGDLRALAVPVVPVLAILGAVAAVAFLSVAYIRGVNYKITRLEAGYPPDDDDLGDNIASSAQSLAWAVGILAGAWALSTFRRGASA